MDLMEEKAELIPGKVDWKGRPARKGKHGGMPASLIVLATLGFENVATLSLAVNLITYFNGTMHYNLADAANQLTNFMATGYALTILAATLADAYIGRFRTVLIGGSLEFLGFGLLTLQAHYKKLTPPLCNVFDPKAKCGVVSGGNAALLYTGLYLSAIGTAGVKAVGPSHGADQFDAKDPKEAIQMSSFFNWLLGASAIGGCISVTPFVWVQDNRGWDWGFGLPTISMFLSVFVLVAGLPQYRMHSIKGSAAITEIMQVFVAAFRNRNLQLPEDAAELYEIRTDKEAALEEDFLPHRDVLR